MITDSRYRSAILSGAILAALSAVFFATYAHSQPQAARQNKIVGTWAPASIEAEIDGQFFDQFIEGSTFPNWNGLRRGREQITLNADGDTMIEHFGNLPDGPKIKIVWRRVGK